MIVEVELELDLPKERIATCIVTVLRSVETLGAPYRFDLTFVQPGGETALEASEVMSLGATIRFTETTGGITKVVRVVKGVVTHFAEMLETHDDNGWAFTAVVEPRFAELGRFVSQDLYAGLTYPKVIEEKLKAAQFATADFDFRLQDPTVYGASEWKDGDPHETEEPRLVVQYAESDMAFISRLAERVGITYFFQYDAEGEIEKLVFTDHPAGFPEGADISFRAGCDDHGITELRRASHAIPSEFFVYDYNYRNPALTFDVDGARLFDALGGQSSLDVPSNGAHVEYAPNAKTAAEAALYAKVRAEAQESQREIYHANGTLAHVFPGLRFKLDNHARIDSSVVHLVKSVQQEYDNPKPFMTSGKKDPRFATTCEFLVASKAGPGGAIIGYRPPLRTPRPRIHGVVTGVVQAGTGSSNNQFLDEQGRYLVKLHLDQTPRTMPRVRMAQPHSGADYGHHFPLRAGAEVLVAFLDGDPDRPVVVGTVPHPLKRSPVTNADPEKSRIRTRSGIKIEIYDGLKS